MKRTIVLGPKLHLPVDVAGEACAFLGRRGGGKTYASGKAAEGYLAARVQIGIIDQVGKWYGLRLRADGKTPANTELVILGGLRGDVPLAAESGALCAELFISSGRSMIFDVSQFSKGARKRWCRDFGEKLWELVKAERNPVVRKIILEEAHLVLPQFVRPDDAPMYGTWEEIIRLGRNHGLGADLLCQRPQSVNKEVLSQVEVVFLFQMNGRTDRKEMQDWLTEKGGDVRLADELPKLQKGEAFLWSPQLLQRFDRVHIGQKETYDSTATPKVGERRVDREVKPIDLGDLQERMAAVKEQAEKNDPAALHRHIRALEAELAKKPSVAPAPPKEIPILNAEERTALQKAISDQRSIIDQLSQRLQMVVSSLGNVETVMRSANARPGMAVQAAQLPAVIARAREASERVQTSARGAFRPVSPKYVAQADAGDGLGKGARAILTAIAQHPDGVSMEQLAVLTGYKRSSRSTYLQALRSQGFVTSGEPILATPEGVAALGDDFRPLPTGPALLEHWRAKLPSGELAVFEAVVSVHPNALSKEKVGEATGYKRSSVATYLQKLKARQLIQEPTRGQVRASELLF